MSRTSRLLLTLAAIGLGFSSPARALDRGLAYVSQQNGGVAVIDIGSRKLIRTLDVAAGGPRGIGISKDGRLLVTANKDGGNLSVIDLGGEKPVRHVKIGKNPEFVRVLGERVYVTYEPSAKGGPPPKAGSAPAADDDDDDLVPARIAIVDVKRGKVLREIVSGPETEGIEFSADGRRMAVTNEADNTITVYDLKSGRLLKTVATKAYGDRPRGIKRSPDGKHYAVTLEFGDKLLLLDADFKPVKAVATGKTPYGVAYDRSGARLFVAASRDNALQVFDATSLEKLLDIPVGQRCWHFSFTPDEREILVACGRSNEVLVIDAEKLEVTGSIAVPGLPWGLVTSPKALGSLDQP
ncbi:MAG: beta-propeller fold lactonase family protein [Azonexus sp.]|nr:beta-propeller fold lactonase family protein [Betaproteobacteria bacterium]MBK8919256.1 beta-propeller fold lactonase family protein [Betaproteobacteria bacterium]MBP6035186.1 beta-propeller fold lactonase family protein [Azonexus sp.]MBP6905769.1 beta-propeller fold lactonase family protein [Azonexus sp.]